MSPTLLRHFGAVLFTGLCLTSLAHAQGLGIGYPRPNGQCNGGGCSACGDPAYQVCKKSNYKAPCYHGSVPFGYYATSWARWPSDCIRHGGIDAAPPLAPESPHPIAEPLPSPRPLDMSRSVEGPRLPRLVPAGYPQRR